MVVKNHKTHDVIRRPGSWDRAIYLLRKLTEAKLPHRINTLVAKSTIPHIGFIAELATAMDCGVSYLPFRTIGRQTSLKENEALDSAKMYEAVQEITRLRSKFPRTRLLTYFDILGEKADYHHSLDCNIPCPARKNGFVAFDGSYYPCDFLRYLGARWHIGNVATESFWTLWTSAPVVHEFRQLEHSKCKECKYYLKQCYGGCTSGSIATTGQPGDELCFKHLLEGQNDIQP